MARKRKTNKKKDISLAYAKLCKKYNRYPTMNEFADATKFTKDMVAHHHGSLGRLKEFARSNHPTYFKNILDDTIFNPKAVKSLKGIVKGNKRFVITTAVTGCVVDKEFLASIKNYCKTNKAELLVLIASDPAADVENDFIDPAIPRDSIVVSDVSFNSNIHISTIKLSAKHIDPITGLTRIGQRNGSFIYASPKQRLKYVATGTGKSSHCVMTTGAVTMPMYKTKRYMSNRTSHIADHDHVMGAIIVEVKNDKIFHFRQVQAKDGMFIDLGNMYYPDKVDVCNPEAVILGDIHSGETDPVAMNCWFQMMKMLKPKRVVVHDVFNGKSINHHEERNMILQAQLAAEGLSLASEFEVLVNDLNQLSKMADEIVIVKSNHDEFLERYLREAKYANDPQNHRLSLDLAIALYEDYDPLRRGCELFGLKDIDKFTWLQRDYDYVVSRVQLGAHGDKGANGTKGTIKSLENAYGNSVTAHSHSPEILRGAWIVGTSSYLKLDYNKGPSSWFHTSCILYNNGSRQLINVIEGEWKL